MEAKPKSRPWSRPPPGKNRGTNIETRVCTSSLTQIYAGQRNSEQQTIQWRISSLSHRSENGGECPSEISLNLTIQRRHAHLCPCPTGVGALLGRFQVTEGPCRPSQLSVQFTSEGSTLSGCDIQLLGTGYRLSLIKKRFAAGQCEPQCLRRRLPASARSHLSHWLHREISGGQLANPAGIGDEKSRWLLTTVKMADPRRVPHRVQ